MDGNCGAAATLSSCSGIKSTRCCLTNALDGYQVYVVVLSDSLQRPQLWLQIRQILLWAVDSVAFLRCACSLVRTVVSFNGPARQASHRGYDSAAGAGSLPPDVSSLGKNFLFSSCAASNESLNCFASSSSVSRMFLGCRRSLAARLETYCRCWQIEWQV